jgi:hypothetical protein
MRKTFVSKCKVWKLNDDRAKIQFSEKVHAKAMARCDADVESMWKELKECLLEVSDEVCGRTKGLPRHRETWWWNEAVARAVKEKRRMYKIWYKSRTERDRLAYCWTRKLASKAVFEAKEAEMKRFGEKLDEEDRKGNVFRVAKQMARKNRAVVGAGCVKDSNGILVAEQEKLLEVWRKYFQSLLNEEFDWNKDGLEASDPVEGPAEEFSASEVRAAIAKMKSGKAVGPSGIAAEMLKAAGEDGVRWVTDICNAVVKEGRIPDDWRKSWMVCVYKGKGDALNCGSYRGIKLLDQVMKVFESILETRLRSKVKLDDMQFGFRPGKGTTDAIFVIRQVQERFLEKKKDLWIAFVDLEKAFDRVPREVLWWALRQLGVEEWIVNVIKTLYENVTTAVKNMHGESGEFGVKVGVHQGSVLSPLLFTMVLEALSRVFREGLPWELLYADDLALMADSEEKLLEKLKRWKQGLEDKGLRVNIGKTKVMKCQVRVGLKEDSGKWPCAVCRKGVGSNSFECVQCQKWVHQACGGVKGNLKTNVKYRCPICSGAVVRKAVECKEVVIGEAGKLDCVDRFCYLGDVIGDGGGVEEATRARVRCAWGKFMELAPILTARRVSLKLKGKMYRSCVQRVLVYASETWAVKVDDMRRLERTERFMIRWMCGGSLRQRRTTRELLDSLGVEDVETVVRRGRLVGLGILNVRREEIGCRRVESWLWMVLNRKAE